ncbi:MAG: hypothetical protein PHT07_19320 [Paludibacter sp.]|nr:hypothetical protein [Paludibacter sp.]
MAKQFPRIHSLSSVGIQHHFHTDYVFHNFRTDFSGDSGVGKSMIADMLQLIFVGSEFLSATEGTNERLAKTMPIGRYGYVFINVEVDIHKYIILGMFISTATINPDPFIIQGGYGKDPYVPLQNPISYRDILNGEIVEDIDAVSIRLDSQFNCLKMTQKVYHEYLMEHELLPIQITDKARLKNYARILRSFARGRDFKHDSESLKYFFFDDHKEKEIHDDFQKRLDNIEADLDGHKRHKEILQNVSAKERDLIELKSLKKEKHESEIELYKAKCIFHFTNIQNKEKEISDNQQKIKNAINCIANFRIDKINENIETIDSLFDQIQTHFDTIQNAKVRFIEINDAKKVLEVKLNEIIGECADLNLGSDLRKTNVIELVEQLYGEMKIVENWIEKYQTIEKLKTAFHSQQENIEKRNKIKVLNHALNEKKLMEVFLSSDWILNDNIEDIYQQKVEEIDNKIKNQKALSKFADTSNPHSLSSWALKNGKSLNIEQESALVYFKDLTTQKPELFERVAKYLPSPEELFFHLNSEKDGSEGFWVKLNGIHEYIPYVKSQLFNTKDINQLEKYFVENYNKSQSKLEKLDKERKGLLALKTLHNQAGIEAINAYKEKEKIENYKFDKNLDKTENEFESYCNHYFWAEDIKKWKVEIDDCLTTINQSNQIKELIDQELLSISRFVSLFKLQAESNPESLSIMLSKLKNEKSQNKKNCEHQLQWYLKITKTLNNSITRNESKELAERKVAKQNIFRITQELNKEKSEYSNYLFKYETLSNEKFKINLNDCRNQYLNPVEQEREFNISVESYRVHYNNIVNNHVHSSSQIRFKDSEDFIALSKEILPEILTRRIVNDELDILQQIKVYLTEITDKYTEFSDVKLNILKEIFTEVRDNSIEYLTEIAELSNYFSRNDCQISQGISLHIDHNYSDAYPIDWIDKFITLLEEKATYTDLFASLAEKINIEEMMRDAYLKCGGKVRKIDVKHLLNPKSYFNIDFSMRKSDGTINSGSTGQTYAAIALLCIARLSLIEKKVSGGKFAKGLRIMPIDETENIGSNFDMLEKIAQDYDYQLIAISRHPLNDYSDKGRYQYMLNGQIEGNKIGTFAIFNEGESAVEYISTIIN